MKKRLITLLFALFIVLQIIACRFTVREIGFSLLSRDIYSLVVLDSSANPLSQSYADITKRLSTSNIRLVILNPETDNNHPALLAARKAKMVFPVTFLMSPDGRILSFKNSGLNEITDEIFNSETAEHFIQHFYNSFAFVLLIEGTDDLHNAEANKILQENCNDITNRIPNMPKQVKNGPEVIRIKIEDFAKERIMLWALGIDKARADPRALVIYGRGRIIGDIIDFDGIVNNRAFSLMAMIGADCECGLDRKWMLGRQVALNWPAQTQQKLTDELGFDVDNPMILAEMSHILSKDPVTDQNSEITFAPEEFDLDQLLSPSDENNTKPQERKDNKPLNLLYVIIIASVLILITGSVIFLRKR